MQPQLQHTNDGSLTLRLEEIDESYHSTHGALTEAIHVYIKNGFETSTNEHLRILEIGFGTGLNALVTLDAFFKQERIKKVTYKTVEKYPIPKHLISALHYGDLLHPSLEQEYLKLHTSVWETETEIAPNFNIIKTKMDLLTDQLNGEFDLIYYDAFAPSKQAEMWEEATLKKVVDTMDSYALLVTYCAKGDVRRLLQSFGLAIQRLPGPPGKWEMLSAKKTNP